VATGIVALLLSGSAPALAAHSYGIVINSNVPAGDADVAGTVTINTNTLSAGGSCSDFVNHEFWYGVVPGATRWVEMGFKDGASVAGCQSRVFFWGENNGSGYHIHLPGNGWSLNAWYTLWISQAANNSCVWVINVGSLTSIGASASNCGGTGRYLAAGIEATSQTVGTVKGWVTNFQRNDGAAWRAGWDSPGLSQNRPPYIQWDNTAHTEAEEVHNVAF